MFGQLATQYVEKRAYERQRSSDLPKFTDLVGGRALWINTQPLLFLPHFQLPLGHVWIYIPTAERADCRTCADPQATVQGETLQLTCPVSCCSELSQFASQKALLSPCLWGVSALTGACLPGLFAAPTSPWSTAVSCVSHCASLHLCSPSAHLHAVHLHVLKDGCVCGLLLCSWTALWSGT